MITAARRPVAASTGLVLVLFILSGLSLPTQHTHASATSGAPAPAGAAVTADTLLPVGQVGGIINAVETQGDYAYVGIGTRLVVWDITDPTQPAPVGQSAILAGVVRDIELSGAQAFVAVGAGGVHILDVSTPATPTELGHFTTYGEAVGVRVSGNYAYVASVFDAFRIYDVANPAAPVEAGYYDGILVAEGLDVAGDYAYVAAGGDGLQVLDVSNPASPTWQGTYASTYAREVIVSGAYAYLADGYGNPNLVVVNVSNPAAPARAGGYAAPGEGYDLALAGSTLYLATWDNGIRFIDVSTPTSPAEIGFYNTAGRAEGVAVAGGHAYVADTWGGAKVVDVSNPAAPALVYAYHSAGEAWDVVVQGSVAFLSDRNNGFYTLDVSDPGAPEILSYYPQSWAGTSEVYLAVAGSTLYVADRDKLYTYDVSDPANPAASGSFAALSDPKGIAVAGAYAYVADGESGLRVLDVQDPAAVAPVGALDTPGDATALLISGDAAYLADGSQGLRIVDISNPAAPSETGAFVPAGYAAGVALAGHHAYLSAGWNGMRIINVSNPATPTEVGFYDEMMGPGVAATEGFAYAIANQFGASLRQLDVTDPVSPTVQAQYELPLGANRMVIAGGQLYVAAGGGGLMIFDVPMPVSLSEVRPHQGRSDWVNEVQVYGGNLDALASFELLPPTAGPATTLDVTPVDATHAIARIPTGLAAGSYALRVSNPDGGQAVLPDAYQVLDPAADLLYAYSDELWTGPPAPITYQETQLGLVLHRAGGSSDLTGLSVDFYAGDPAAGGLALGTGSIPLLAPDSYTTTMAVSWTPSTEGYHEIYARVNGAAPFTVHRSVWVMPPAVDLSPPSVDSVVVNGGVTDVPGQLTGLSIRASDPDGGSGVDAIYIIEFDWNPNMGEWVPVNESGWLDYAGSPTTLPWTLNWAPGVKNVVVWAADRAGNVSTRGYVAWMNFIPPQISINQGQMHMFSYWLTAGGSFSAQTTPSVGDPDLYLGDASGWLAHSINTGTQPDAVAITVSSTGLHTLAVYGWTTARYALNVTEGWLHAGALRSAPRANDPVALPLPPSGQGAPDRRALPPPPTGYRVYVPMVMR
jgi:hypothetical protein